MTRRAVGDHALVAGDLTTTGELLEPFGDLTEEELYDVYCQQIRALAAAGADLLVAETHAERAGDGSRAEGCP